MVGQHLGGIKAVLEDALNPVGAGDTEEEPVLMTSYCRVPYVVGIFRLVAREPL